MDKNKIVIIILLVIIVILAAAIGFTLFNSKEPSKIKITSDNEQNEGGELSIMLTDFNKTPISSEIVNVAIADKNGKVVVDDVVKTNSKGKAKLDLDLKKGKYVVNVTYDGNENYSGNITSQKLTIKEKVVESTVSQSSNSSSSSQNSEREEYQITPDGWNPREHEVSRDSIGDGRERVHYDDGYFRVVDQDGNILTHGWE